MAVINPAIFLQAGTHPAEDIRRFIDAVMTSKSGIVGSGDFAVTENGTPNMTVTVAAGRAFILGSQSSAQGVYMVESRTTNSVTVTAADATNPRKDLIVAKVEDSAYSGATDAWSLACVAGTPAGSPAEPSAPNNSIVLAMIDIPATDTAITNSQITDRRITTSGQGYAVALGGVQVATSSARPTATEGRVIYETDTDKVKAYDGAAWNDVGGITIVRKTANESVTSSTTLQNDDHLTTTLGIGTHRVEAIILVTGAAAGDFKCDWTFSGTATTSSRAQIGPAGTTTDVSDTNMRAFSSAIGTSVGYGVDGSLTSVIKEDLLFVVTVAGTLQLRWAQSSSSGTATTVLSGSRLYVTKSG